MYLRWGRKGKQVLIKVFSFQMNSDTFSIKKVFHMVKEERPIVLILETHHYVQMSETSLEEVGVKESDLDSALILCPVGANVPIICRQQLKKVFRNMKVHCYIKFCIDVFY